MRISSTSNRNLSRSGSLWFIVTMLVVLVGILLLSDFLRPETSDPIGVVVLCDAEEVSGEMFVTNGVEFAGGSSQSSARAFRGRYSCRLNTKNQDGIEYELRGVKEGEKYKASVWMSRTSGNRGSIAAKSGNNDVFFTEQAMPEFRREDGWELLHLTFTVPDDVEWLKVYVAVPEQSGDTYFDDFTIERIDSRIRRPDSVSGALSSVDITIDKKDIDKLSRKKWEAVANGILVAKDDDWVNVKLQTGDQEIPGKARLKGDWLDHLREGKWSLRIKVKSDYAWNRLATFSIQSPQTRYYLSEWIYHEFLRSTDVLTPRYDFISVAMNGKDLGVFAYEEHFEKQLVESKNRREGPILKYAEDGFWGGYKLEQDLYGDGTLGARMSSAYWQSEVRPFKESKTLANPALEKQYARAQDLLYGFKYGIVEANEAFDLELFARYFAITDLFMAYHGMAWHNVRYYYNPVTGKLEPIGFDGFSTTKPKADRNRPILGYYASPRTSETLFYSLMYDNEFARAYQQALWRYSNPVWFGELLSELDQDIKLREQLLIDEFPEAKIDVEELKSRAREVRFYLIPQNNSSLSARTVSTEEQYKTIQLSNQFHLGLEATGYAGSSLESISYFDEPIFIATAARGSVPVVEQVTVPRYAEYLVFQLAGVDSVFTTKISDLPPVGTAAIQYNNVDGTGYDTHDWIGILGNEATMRSGDHVLTSDLVFPKGMRVNIEPGTRLDIKNNARVVIQGQFAAIGTEEAPIMIQSSDKSASGFTVLNADEAVLTNVSITGLNTQRDPGHTLTGSVTFYECNVVIRNCVIGDNLCEDALNTVRSTVDIDNLFLFKTLFDAYDSDFCKGIVRNIRFEDVSNDALDFSGSTITVENCIVNRAGDKGISVGEESNIKVLYAELNDCNIGVASKDLSVLDIDKVILRNCNQGFTAYQKKPEFGPAKLVIRSYEMIDVQQPYLIERNSELMLEWKLIEGI